MRTFTITKDFTLEYMYITLCEPLYAGKPRQSIFIIKNNWYDNAIVLKIHDPNASRWDWQPLSWGQWSESTFPNAERMELLIPRNAGPVPGFAGVLMSKARDKLVRRYSLRSQCAEVKTHAILFFLFIYLPLQSTLLSGRLMAGVNGVKKKEKKCFSSFYYFLWVMQ